MELTYKLKKVGLDAFKRSQFLEIEEEILKMRSVMFACEEELLKTGNNVTPLESTLNAYLKRAEMVIETYNRYLEAFEPNQERLGELVLSKCEKLNSLQRLVVMILKNQNPTFTE